ncbi:exocyst complex protein exo70 [Cercophora newfieldiana]|uniref:Exocyst complex protein exo70 n=1 Tax=Cercophora newfieldiana TaxID=92897 RepID=A0AA40CQI3_9PEZI|nr:exocyst complex protein exo70 [Cercophora newfieldiana]
MVPVQLNESANAALDREKTSAADSAVLHRHLDASFLSLAKGEGSYLVLEDGRKIFDGSGGAAVGCIGWGNQRVAEAVTRQILDVPYCPTIFYTTKAQEDLCRTLVETSNGHMARAYIVNSGSEAMEAAVKLARQYYLELDPPQPQRAQFISRKQSYHGITLGALAIGGHAARRAKFEPMLMKNVTQVSPCFEYRGKTPGESDEAYVERLTKELDDEFQRVGPDTVCAFVAEPVVGAALGCVPAVPGYFKAVRAVCENYGALLILDEVMCGMGRTGTLHAWEQEGVAPDIQTIGKGLGGGYQSIAGVLAGHRVVDTLAKGSSVFVHGHTYQGHPAGCAAALEVQKIIQEEGLLNNVQELAPILSNGLVEAVGGHPNVGNIRGRGFFWGIEFVADKETATPFPPEDHVAMDICEFALTKDYGVGVYPGGGSVDGIRGDHIIISPPYNVSRDDIQRPMAVGLSGGRAAADEEARAEVDVLNSRLEKTTQLTKKIQACLGRLEETGKAVRDVAGPLNGETKKLQLLGNNIESVISAIERLRQPADSKNDEERIIRMGPDKAGLSNYLASIKRLNKALGDMKASNLRSTKQTVDELQRLVKSGNTQLENAFDKLLRLETPRDIEPLHFITKNKAFPTLTQELITRLGLINEYVSGVYKRQGGSGESPIAKIYAELRSQRLSASLVNLAAASSNTAKKKNPDAIYRTGTNGIGTYAQAMEGLFLAEYENICSIFTREDWGPVFQATCQPALLELGRTLRELNNHIKAHMNTDCYLAYEIVEIISGLSNNLETRTGELKSSFAGFLRPVRDTAKSSLAELLEDTKRRVNALQVIPADGAPLPIVSETMQRLQSMVDFLRPISSIMVSLGDGGWRSTSASARGGGGGDAIPSLSSFDIGADGKEIFAHYCADTIDALMSALEGRARVLLQQRKPVMGVFLANSVAIIERMIRDSDLAPLLDARRGPLLDTWRKKAASLYTDTCKDISVHLFDVIHTSRGRPTSGGQNTIDSSAILKGLSSKDKENIKTKFAAFNLSFDEMVARHKQYSMEREVKQAFAKDVQNMIEPLYNRFWDRYHEVDKGKGKYVKYDKSAIAAVFLTLY